MGTQHEFRYKWLKDNIADVVAQAVLWCIGNGYIKLDKK